MKHENLFSYMCSDKWAAVFPASSLFARDETALLQWSSLLFYSMLNQHVHTSSHSLVLTFSNKMHFLSCRSTRFRSGTLISSLTFPQYSSPQKLKWLILGSRCAFVSGRGWRGFTLLSRVYWYKRQDTGRAWPPSTSTLLEKIQRNSW